jgi:hypothetical protein
MTRNESEDTKKYDLSVVNSVGETEENRTTITTYTSISAGLDNDD